MKKNFKELLHDVTCFVFDVDGVLTDGSVTVLPGELVRTMNIRDGYALHEAVKNGYPVFVISGGKSESVRTRLQHLGIQEIHLGVSDKTVRLDALVRQYNLDPANILYMGDDLPDYQALLRCGVPTCPRDAAPEIREICLYISSFEGGRGCVRDVIEQTLRLQNKWHIGADTSSSQ